jgi:hypothetical protein
MLPSSLSVALAGSHRMNTSISSSSIRVYLLSFFQIMTMVSLL